MIDDILEDFWEIWVEYRSDIGGILVGYWVDFREIFYLVTVEQLPNPHNPPCAEAFGSSLIHIGSYDKWAYLNHVKVSNCVKIM